MDDFCNSINIFKLSSSLDMINLSNDFLSIHFKLDVAFDGADEVDVSLNLIKGGG